MLWTPSLRNRRRRVGFCGKMDLTFLTGVFLLVEVRRHSSIIQLVFITNNEIKARRKRMSALKSIECQRSGLSCKRKCSMGFPRHHVSHTHKEHASPESPYPSINNNIFTKIKYISKYARWNVSPNMELQYERHLPSRKGQSHIFDKPFRYGLGKRPTSSPILACGDGPPMSTYRGHVIYLKSYLHNWGLTRVLTYEGGTLYKLMKQVINFVTVSPSAGMKILTNYP